MNPEEKKSEIIPSEIKPPIKSLRTYQGDVDEVVSKNNYSTSDIFLAEQKRRGNNSLIGPQDTTDKNKFFILLGGAFFVLGILAIVGVYYVKSTEKVALIQKTKALIGFSKEVDWNIASTSRENFINKIISEKQSFNLPLNSVLYINTINPDSSTGNIEDIISLLAPNIPSSLSRSFENKYMLGIYSFDTNEPFIILTTNDFSTSFAGMLKWEDNITTDIGRIFSISQNALATNSTFSDETLKNKDLRVLKNSSGKTVLLYSFIDKNTLIITTNENIFTAILAKYLISQQEK